MTLKQKPPCKLLHVLLWVRSTYDGIETAVRNVDIRNSAQLARASDNGCHWIPRALDYHKVRTLDFPDALESPAPGNRPDFRTNINVFEVKLRHRRDWASSKDNIYIVRGVERNRGGQHR